MSASLDSLRLRRLLDAGRALVSELDPQAVLDRILATAREVSGARYAALGVLDEQRTALEQFLTLGIDEQARAAIGDLPRGRGVLGVLIREPQPLRLSDVSEHPRSYGFPEGHPAMRGFLGVPIIIRGVAWGNLYLAEKADGEFTAEDEEAAVILAEWAATAIEMRRSVESERLRSSMAAADAERSRWARELHDETLQGLGALRLLLASARRRGDAKQTVLAVDEAIEQIEQEIENLHAIITDLRPATLDELGLRPTLEALLERRSDHSALTIASELMLPDPLAGDDRLQPEIESTIYRLVQEALTNVAKHANARNVRVAVIASATGVSVEVKDDGVGFAAPISGFGLAGMRERVHRGGGTLTVDSGKQGTLVRAELPVNTRGATGPSAADQAAS